MRLRRSRRVGLVITVTPMVDALLILLVFFMVTSTYLDLDMIPMVEKGAAPGPAVATTPQTATIRESRTVLVRLRPDGRPVLRGEAMTGPALTAALAARVASAPDTRVVILPSGQANAQALVSLLEGAARAGVSDIRVVRLEAP
ncbi:ExbD/TolR family protein [Rhodospira trueperi]|uniref:Biopolymer transport protein ExbD n=1 Tax=Rhodospira trueperi TaxID=69960 RepID=A0A1G7AVS0_9PROT|nr:biopolymer transporter ExbD [Rhodospira trueperi]SDE18046.1 biopolymer transport protein ExbD [Rhodospira trueperi]